MSGSNAKMTGREAGCILLCAVVSGGVTWLTAADLAAPSQHKEFVDFFASAAAVIGALLIALAIEARAALPLKAFAAVAPLCLALGEAAAVAGCTPALPGGVYRWLLAVTVGGGVGGLVAVLWAAAKLLRLEVHEARIAALLDARAVVVAEEERRKAAGGKTS